MDTRLKSKTRHAQTYSQSIAKLYPNMCKKLTSPRHHETQTRMRGSERSMMIIASLKQAKHSIKKRAFHHSCIASALPAHSRPRLSWITGD